MELVESLVGGVPFRTVVETGTYRGSTTEYLAGLTTAPVVTIEVQPRFFWYAKWRLRKQRHVCVIQDDSVAALTDLGMKGALREPVFFYLDAHWEKHLPLREEVALIQRHWTDWVALVDDFQVPDDPGYGFDDYGAAGSLTLDYLAPVLAPDVRRFWPAAHSSTETATRKGCMILASASMGAQISSLSTVREGTPPASRA